MNTAITRLFFVALFLLYTILALPVTEEETKVVSGSDLIRGLFGINNVQESSTAHGIDKYTPPVDGIHDGEVSMSIHFFSGAVGHTAWENRS